MPRLISISDEGWITIGLRATTDPDNVPDPMTCVNDARLIFEQISALPEVPDLHPDLVQAEELAAAHAFIERQAARALDADRPALGVAPVRPATVSLPDAFEGDSKSYLDFKPN